MKTDIITLYKMALIKAENMEKLQCHVLAIKKKIEQFENGEVPTTLDKIWIDYFLDNNNK